MPLAKPTQITVPFAKSGNKNAIPVNDSGSNRASMQKGFPAITMQNVDQGGLPPYGEDVNGILFDVTKAIQYQQAGGLFPYDAAFATAIDGYPLGAILTSADGTKLYQNLLNGNQSNPENGGVNWKEITDLPIKATGSTTARNLSDRFADIINVKDFGAKGDGVTDDTVAINAAVTASNGRIIFFPEGTYIVGEIYISSDIIQGNNHPYTFVGCGIGSTTIKSNSLGENIFSFNGIYGIKITDMTLDCNENGTVNADYSGSCFWACDCSNITLDNILFKNFQKAGILTFPTYTQGVECKNYNFNNLFFDGSLFYTGSYTGGYNAGMICASVKGGTIRNSKAFKCSFFGIEWKGARRLSTESSGLSENCWSINCSSDRCGKAFTFGGEDVAGYTETIRHKNSGCISCYATDSIFSIFGIEYGKGVIFSDCRYFGNPDSVIIGRISNSGIIGMASSQDCYFKGTAVDSDFFLSRLSGCTGCYVEFTEASPNTDAFYQSTGILAKQDTQCTECQIVARSGTVNTNILISKSLGVTFATEGICIYVSGTDGTRNYRTANDYTITSQYFSQASNGKSVIHRFSDISGTYNELQTVSQLDAGFYGIIPDKTGSESFRFYSDRFISSNQSLLGRGDKLWGQIYSTNSTISTSDERMKHNISDISDDVLDAWGNVNLRIFQLKDAVEKKGESARLHTGVVAQQVKSAFEAKGLDAFRYGLLCYDKWDDEFEDVEIVDKDAVIDADGNEIEPAVTHIEQRLITPAGDRYSIRYEEALILEAAYQRRRADRIESRLKAIEERMA